ncbi:hypothetical protein GH714_039211 [Hevea brasiliensis]|uniref:Uncharacterized protein n=1 Tax=Hevea brasiliensis TaxID=3981 RepID=A0A6A6LWV7_HEVBR|nr:hypothetical protein GH714_039211 [Hevea brasiliensis]
MPVALVLEHIYELAIEFASLTKRPSCKLSESCSFCWVDAPPRGWIKINVDGTCIPNPRAASGGGELFNVVGMMFSCMESTIGAAFFTQVLSLNEATVKFDIWDTAGQERYHSLAPMYYRGAAAAVVVYDITSMESFERAKKWVLELQRQGNPNLIMFLAANKADLEEKRKVAIEEGEQYAKENGLVFLETSAKTAQNVNELFYEIAKKLVKAAPLRPTGMKLHTRQQESGRRMLCCS